MTVNEPIPPDDTSIPAAPAPYPSGVAPLPSVTTPGRLPISKLTLWGFVISCVGLAFFGILGVLGVGLSAQGYRAARQGRAGGRGLAIAGMVIGTIGFAYYAFVVLGRLVA